MMDWLLMRADALNRTEHCEYDKRRATAGRERAPLAMAR